MTQRLLWRCKCCDAAGYDAPGLRSFWAHYRGWHLPNRGSMFVGVTGR